ncbi:MAG: hypothetical protein AABY22_04190, partial [Nanoarchaeota archaeon]
MSDKREADIVLVLGRQGVGKTVREKLECEAYVMNDPQKARRGRKSLVFDCNVRSGSYSGVKTINYIDTHKESRDRCAEISAWNKDINEFRRIINIKGSNGQAMSMEEMNIAALDIMAHFTDGRLVLEDTNKYLFGAGQKKFV